MVTDPGGDLGPTAEPVPALTAGELGPEPPPQQAPALTLTGHAVCHNGVAGEAGAHGLVPHDAAHLLARPVVCAETAIRAPTQSQAPVPAAASRTHVGAGEQERRGGREGPAEQRPRGARVPSTAATGADGHVGATQGVPRPPPSITSVRKRPPFTFAGVGLGHGQRDGVGESLCRLRPHCRLLGRPGLSAVPLCGHSRREGKLRPRSNGGRGLIPSLSSW